ncbi:hypothetical protein HUU42_02915, partial [bacterium]|nr:hypothetical protein [bacterium]
MAIRFSQSEWDRAIRNATPISWDIPLEQSILAWKTSGGVIATWSCKLCWYIRPTGIDNDFTFEGCPCPGRGSGGGNGGGSVPDTLQNLKWCDSKFAYSKKNGFGCSGRCKEGMECKLVFREHSSGIFQLACQCIMQLPDLTINDAVPKPFYIDWPNKKVVANIINKGNAPAGPFRVYLEISKYDATRRPESQSEEYFSELEVGEARRIVIPLNKFSPPINIS